MLTKLLGSLLIACAGFFISVSFCRFESKRLSVLDSYISLLFYIKGQVDCYLRPIDEILMSVDFDIIKGCGCREKPCSIFSMLDESKIYLEKESYRLLYTFASEFGSVYKDEQLLRCDYYIEALSEERRGLFDEVPSRNKVARALFMCASFALLIILW